MSSKFVMRQEKNKTERNPTRFYFINILRAYAFLRFFFTKSPNRLNMKRVSSITRKVLLGNITSC